MKLKFQCLTVFGFGKVCTVFRTISINKFWTEQIRAALEFDTGLPAEFIYLVFMFTNLNLGSVTLPFISKIKTIRLKTVKLIHHVPDFMA